MSGDPKVIIVGAGAAGIAAASRLVEKGLRNILVLEAKNPDNLIELGAQWCHGEKDNIVYSLAAPHNLLESSKYINNLPSHIFVNSIGEVISEQETAELLNIYYKILNDADTVVHKPGTSFGDYFTERYDEKVKIINLIELLNIRFYREANENPSISKDKLDQIIDWIHSYHNSIDCTDTWYDLSAVRQQDYHECEGDLLLNWKTNGYSKVFDLLTKNYPDPTARLPVYEKILFNKEVLHIDYSSGKEIKVVTTDGSIYKASNLIFTASLGVLKEQYSRLFTPSLPPLKIRAIKGFNIGVANKIFLEFPYRWWPQHSGGLCFMWSQAEKKKFKETHTKDQHWLCDVFKFFTVDNQPSLLNGWVVGPNAKYIEGLSDEKVLNDLYFLLQKFLSHIYDIPKPKAIIRSKWYSDKHTRGSYSNQTLETEKLNVRTKDLYDPIKGSTEKPLILFAGEATHEHYYSTVHGAIETGFREADRIIDYYRCIKPHL
ncbi:hypothetical protein TSAR_012048 [Trichomalopsis sarcophagae]|uniref:Amine oxidase domain-containing protein n=1 Tax=Trichomalopsis sarcophagae TaxID=543379 RepID=A0A232F4P6_9HYME|nr:hypothetical protein TSAR_012048 [Trichomalopsis sarcophagae]